MSLAPALRLVALVAAAAAIAGCAGKIPRREPAKLISIDEPSVKLKEVWSRSVGNGSGGIASGLRVVAAEDGLFAAAANGLVIAIDPKNGDSVWQTKTRARVISGPSVADDQVYVGTLDGELIALARADGKERWRVTFPAEVIAPVAISGDTVIVRTIDGREFGIRSRDGSRIWNYDGNEPNLTLRGMSPPLVLDNRVYTGLDNGRLAALNIRDGSVAWEQPVSIPSGRSELERLADIDSNLLSSNLGIAVVTYGNDIAMLDPSTGDSKWRRSIKSYSGLTADQRQIYVSDDDGLIWALDPETGGANWKQDKLKYRRLSAPVPFKDLIVAGDFEGYLHVFSARDGGVMARTRLSSDPVVAPPIVAGDRLFVMDSDGHLAAYEKREIH